MPDVDPDVLAAEVRRSLGTALAASGLDTADPDVRRAVLAALTDKPLDRKLSARDKRRYACELRRAGGTYREIAPLVGYASPGAAQKAVMAALKEIPRESAEELRQMAVERLDAILAGGLYRKATGMRSRGGKDPDHKEQMEAIDRVVKVMAEVRRYVPGLEVPVSTEHSGIGGAPITVEFAGIPEPIPVAPVAQSQLGHGIIDVGHKLVRTEGYEEDEL